MAKFIYKILPSLCFLVRVFPCFDFPTFDTRLKGKSWVNRKNQLSGTKQVCINRMGPNIAFIKI